MSGECACDRKGVFLKDVATLGEFAVVLQPWAYGTSLS